MTMTGPDMDPVRRLTVHVLDTALGRPAAGLGLVLSRNGTVLARQSTNPDGRCDAPLLAGTAFAPGTYEIAFDVAGWRAATGAVGNDLGFYDVVTIRFMADAASPHVHIPLLLSPYGYSTYRGS